MAYYNIEQFGPIHDEFMLGQIVAAIINARPFRKEGSIDANPTDYMPSYEPEPESWLTIRENLQAWKGISDDS